MRVIACEYFRQILSIRNTIDVLGASARKAMEQATKMTTDTDKLNIDRSSDQRTAEKAAINYAEVAQLLRAKQSELSDLLKEATEIIVQMKNNDHIQLLTLRYIDDHEWSDVAQIMGFEPEYCRGGLHSKALAEAQTIIDKTINKLH